MFLLGNFNNSYGAKIKELITKLSVANHIKFLGHINHDDLRDYFNLADVAVSLTLKDGFPASLTEIMACGKPIISGKNRSITELVTDNRNGFIINPKDSKELAQKLIILHNDYSLIKRFKNNNIEDVKNHSSSKYCDLITSQYKLLKN